jgi:hypothetical protein
MSKNGIDIGQIAMIGALLVGGYFVLKYVMPLLKGLGDVGEAVVGAPAAVITAVTTPIVPSPPGYPAAPSPINYGIPITGVPGFVEFAQTPITGPETGGPSYGAFLFPPLGILDIVPVIQRAISPPVVVSRATDVPGLISSNVPGAGPFITYTGAPQIIAGPTSFTGLRSNVSLFTRGR